MGSSPAGGSEAVGAEFRAAFTARAGAGGVLPFDQFMALALYGEGIGYYRRRRPRVGYGRGTDFFTATTSGPLFGELVAAACVTLLRGADPREYAFVEIGAEPSATASPADDRAAGGVLAGVEHPFGAATTLPLGAPLVLRGKCVVFSNELFDAQPCRRFVFRRGAWRELGVALREDRLVEIELEENAAELPAGLPASAPEGYHLDAPLAAAALARELAAQAWSGVFVACDYGKSWRELSEATPAGTARAYFQHTQSNDLLARPGEQDLTCHICWDWLATALRENGFAVDEVQSQEAFFVRHAEAFIAQTVAEEAARFSPRKRALLQLLHPAHLGQKFQVLAARRDA
jgi:SAM-dependent MidA family methyltransferase